MPTALAKCLPLSIGIALLTGCGASVPPRADTGAKQAASDFFSAIIDRDWTRAFELLAPESQATGAEAFTKLAESYRTFLRFEPKSVSIRTCEERGDEATAHLNITGVSKDGKSQTYRESILLRRVDDGWRVIPSSRFGKAPRH